MASEAQRRANQKYKEKNKGIYVEMRYKVTIEERDMIKAYCDVHNVTVSEFIKKLVFDTINGEAL